MMLKIKIILVLVFLNIFAISNSNAVWNGYIDDQNKRAVPILWDANGVYCNGSGFLYSPRIVFIAGHSMFKDDDRKTEPVNKFEKMWVGLPGGKVSYGSYRVEAEKFFISKDYKGRDAWRGGNTVTRQNEFAIIVLKDPLPVDNKPVELLTPELHDKWVQNKEIVSLMGYGGNSPETLRKTCDIITPASFDSTVIEKDFNLENFNWTATFNTMVEIGKPNICDGDSGAGYVKVLKDKYIYIGAAGAGSWNYSDCDGKPGIPGSNVSYQVNGIDPVYKFLDLIKDAENYIANTGNKNILKSKKNKKKNHGTVAKLVKAPNS